RLSLHDALRIYRRSKYPSPPQTLNCVYGHGPPLYHTFVFLPLSLSLPQFLSLFTPPHSFSPTLFLSTSLIFLSLSLSLSLYLPLFPLPLSLSLSFILSIPCSL